jgi:hypothetical protein
MTEDSGHFLQRDRRKIFPFHRDQQGYTGDASIVRDTIVDLSENGGEQSQEALKKHGSLNRRGDRSAMFHRTKNSFNDPLSVYFVLDAIVESARGVYLRPSYLVHYLNDHVPQIWWNNGVVGRIMAGFSHLCMQLYFDDDFSNEYLLEEHRDEAAKKAPFAQGRDAQGRFYVVDPEGGDEGLLWLLQARQIWLDLAIVSMQDDAAGTPGENWGKAEAPYDYFVEHLDEPVRDAKAFRAQLGGAQTFKDRRPAPKKTLKFNG